MSIPMGDADLTKGLDAQAVSFNPLNRSIRSIREPHLWLGVQVCAEARGFLFDPGADGTRQ
ncbi:MAG: hypothetical protein ACXVDA_25425, partial [Ktedonobacterales bacterium]